MLKPKLSKVKFLLNVYNNENLLLNSWKLSNRIEFNSIRISKEATDSILKKWKN